MHWRVDQVLLLFDQLANKSKAASYGFWRETSRMLRRHWHVDGGTGHGTRRKMMVDVLRRREKIEALTTTENHVDFRVVSALMFLQVVVHTI